MTTEALGFVVVGSTMPCQHCITGTAVAVTSGKWTNAGDGYAEVIYRHDGCPAVDPAARSQRPQLLQNTTVTTRRRWWRRSTSRSR